MPAQIWAHGGHDHAAEAVPSSSKNSPYTKTYLSSDQVEMVAMARGPGLWLYVDEFATNNPITNATISVESEGHSLMAKQANADGVYQFDAPWLLKSGKYDLIITIQSDTINDMVVGSLGVSGQEEDVAVTIWGKIPQWSYLIFGLIVFNLVFLFYKYFLNKRKKISKYEKNLKSVSRDHAA
jgi:hypothetical protein